MVPTRRQVGLVLLLLTLSFPQGILAWDSPLLAGRFLCKPSTAYHGRGPDWLDKQEKVGGGTGTPLLRRAECGYTTLTAPTMRFSGIVQGDSGRATSVSATPAWKQAGIYGLEFGTAAVGALASATGAFWVTGTAFDRGEDPWPPSVFIAGGIYALTSTFMSTAGTYFIGRLLGQGGSFGHALAGGAGGGLVGGGALMLLMSTNDPPLFLIPVGLASPALGSVISYNVWRNK